MRLLWAGVLLLVPLVADLATARRCSGVPDAPEHASVRCFKRRGTCRAMCQEGYIFTEKGSQSAMYNCEGGEWVMRDGEADKCDAICDPPCENGGYCSTPNQCTCPAGYEGASCETPVCTPECMNGGYCTGPNYCQCPHGYSGYHCENDDMAITEEPTTEDEDDYGDEDEDTEVGKSSEVEPVTQSHFAGVMVPLKFEADVKRLVNRLVAVEYIKENYPHLLVYPEEENNN